MTHDELIGTFTTLDMERLQQLAPTINTDLVLLGCVCAQFINPPTLPKNQQEHAIVVNRGLVAAEFLRLYVDKKISINQLGRHERKDLKEFIRLQARLWGETWKTIQQVYAVSPKRVSEKPEAFFFQAVIMESGLTEPFLTDSHSWGESVTATKTSRRSQNLNRALQTAFNTGATPFDRDRPYTWELIQQSIALAERNDDFRKQYLKMVEARMALVDYLRFSRPKIASSNPQIKPEKRGRKPKL